MRCEKFEMLWNDCLDQRISPQSHEQLSAHAAMCPRCAELMAGGELLNFAFPGLPQPTLSANFSDRVVASLRTQQTRTQPVESPPIPVAYEVFAQSVADSRSTQREANHRKRLHSKIIYWSSGVAAAIAVIATFALTTPKGDSDQKVNITPNVVNVAPINVVRPIAVVQPAKTPQANVVNVAPAHVAPVVEEAPASDYFPASSTIAVGTVFRRDSMSQVGFAVADGITPVTKSVTFALQSFPKTAVIEKKTVRKNRMNRFA